MVNDGSKSKYYIMVNFCPHNFMGDKWRWWYGGRHLIWVCL